MSNWGRYLTLLPPIDGADAVSGSPYFTEIPGQRAHMWDSTVTLQYMPRQYITWWAEVGYRHSDVPYFAGRGGVTPPGSRWRQLMALPGNTCLHERRDRQAASISRQRNRVRQAPAVSGSPTFAAAKPRPLLA